VDLKCKLHYVIIYRSLVVDSPRPTRVVPESIVFEEKNTVVSFDLDNRVII